MKRSVNREKYVQSYINNRTMEIETNKKMIIESKFVFIVIFLLCMLFNIILQIEFKRFDICAFLSFIGIGLIIYLIIKYDNWKLKLENNIIYIERKIFPSYTINVDNIIKIQHYIYHEGRAYREYLEITYFNNKNKIKKDHLYIYKNSNYFVEEDKIKEFIKIFSDYVENLDDNSSDIRDIKRSDEQVEKLYKKASLNKTINGPVKNFFTIVFTIIRTRYSRHRYFISDSGFFKPI